MNSGLGKTAETVKPAHMDGAAAVGFQAYSRRSYANESQLVFSSRILSLIASGLSKCCVVLFLRLLFTTENKAPFKLCTVCVGIAAAWAVAAPLTVSVGCSASRVLEPEPSSGCPGDVCFGIKI